MMCDSTWLIYLNKSFIFTWYHMRMYSTVYVYTGSRLPYMCVVDEYVYKMRGIEDSCKRMIWKWARRCYTSSASTTSSSEFCRGRCQPHSHSGGWVIPSVGWESVQVFLYSEHSAHCHLFLLDWLKRLMSFSGYVGASQKKSDFVPITAAERRSDSFVFSRFFMRSLKVCVCVCFLLIMWYTQVILVLQSCQSEALELCTL